MAGQRRLRELEGRHQALLDQNRSKFDEDEHALRHEVLRLTNSRESLEDNLRSLTERARIAESNHETERRSLRESYDADVAALQDEIRVLKEQREKAESSHKREMERLTKGDEGITQSLRKTIETLRHEKQQQADDARQSKESAVTEHNAKLHGLQSAIENLRRESADERTARKEAEAAKQSAIIKLESLQSQVSRLTSELEHTQVEARTRERATEQDHNQLVDHLRGQMRGVETENALSVSNSRRLI